MNKLGIITRGETTLEVLDHGYVKYIDSMGTDASVIEAARMSTGKGFVSWEPYVRCSKCGLHGSLEAAQRLGSQLRQNECTHDVKEEKGDAHLLEYLYKNHHMTPFEMPRLIVEVKAPIFIFREWHRHRQWSYNEFSARYSQMPNEHYVPPVERFIAKQSTNKQESSADQHLRIDYETPYVPGDSRRRAEAEQALIYQSYSDMIDDGVPKEVARINTPVSRYSKMRAGVSLRGALDFLVLRNHPAAQNEMQQYAIAFAQIVATLWPRTYALFEEHTRGAVTLSRNEVREMKELFKGELALPREAESVCFPLSEGFLEKFK